MAEGSVAVFNVGTAPVRVLKVTTLVDGMPTVVDMQVVALADAEGRPLQLNAGADQIVEELQTIRQLLEMLIT